MTDFSEKKRSTFKLKHLSIVFFKRLTRLLRRFAGMNITDKLRVTTGYLRISNRREEKQTKSVKLRTSFKRNKKKSYLSFVFTHLTRLFWMDPIDPFNGDGCTAPGDFFVDFLLTKFLLTKFSSKIKWNYLFDPFFRGVRIK